MEIFFFLKKHQQQNFLTTFYIFHEHGIKILYFIPLTLNFLIM